MNRRDFLKLAAVASLGMVVVRFPDVFPSSLPAVAWHETSQVALGGRLFKGTTDGRILVSQDGGSSWRCCANFGGQCSVKDLQARAGQLFAGIGIPDAAFELVSSDGIRWRTAG